MNQNFKDDFGNFENRIWMNCAHQGPLPVVAETAARRAIRSKVAPHLISDTSFDDVPNRLRMMLGELIGKSGDELILGNSASHGIHLLANGIQWNAGDEVIVVHGDFPATVFPWLRLREIGVDVRVVSPRDGRRLDADDLALAISPKTRLVCVSWVNSYTGWSIDLPSIGAVCRERDIWFVVNGSQALGARTIDLKVAQVDAIVCCGYKWLCGPYGTGFCWVAPALLGELVCQQAYWWSLRDVDVKSYESSHLNGGDSRLFDTFCTANFFNFEPWIASLEYLLEKTIECIMSYDNVIVRQLIDGVDRSIYRIVSSVELEGRSTLVVLCHRQPERNRSIFEELRESGMDIAIRRQNLRLSPHIYNTSDEVNRVLDELHRAGS